ncbi:hypothetical protein SCLCIDRAFT_272725 [Scleroderma citrinum Foug A]|uniref:Uncharacterized protein n=1 Tax=Scleroderma citrinum Foug A TaxID=1036808 RepID=A0A0C3DI50_9AGAM|nr:hypothetical protein SCLCIDRAFT_272725 [Scleroderma citrinum Foug A]
MEQTFHSETSVGYQWRSAMPLSINRMKKYWITNVQGRWSWRRLTLGCLIFSPRRGVVPNSWNQILEVARERFPAHGDL